MKCHSQSFRESGAQSTDWLLAGGRPCGLDVALALWMLLLPKLVPSCRRLMWRMTAVALKACCKDRHGDKPRLHRCRRLQVCAVTLTLHLLLAKFFRICRLTDSWMFLQRAVSPAILKDFRGILFRKPCANAAVATSSMFYTWGKTPAASLFAPARFHSAPTQSLHHNASAQNFPRESHFSV